MAKPFKRITRTSDQIGHVDAISSDLDIFLNEMEKKHPGILKWHVGVITVFGSNDLSSRKLFTDWIIHFFEYGQRANNSRWTLGTPGKLEYIPNKFSLSDGLYFRPELFEVRVSGSQEPLVCLIMYIEGKSEEIDRLAVSVCSQAIVFRQSEKDKLLKTVANTYDWEIAKAIKFIHVHPIMLTSNHRDVETKFLENLEKHPVPGKQIGINETLCLKSLVNYLGNAVNILNKKQGIDNIWNSLTSTKNPGHTEKILSDMDSKTATKAQKNFRAEVTINIEDDQTHESSSSKATGLLVSKSENTTSSSAKPEDPSGQEFTKGINKLSSGKKTCDNFYCQVIQKKIQSDLEKWADTPEALWYTLDIFDSLNYDEAYGHYKHFDELKMVFVNYEKYVAEVLNSFDNYVCFHGINDRERLESSSKFAYEQAVEALQRKEVAHFEFCKDAIFKVCNRAHKIISAQNNHITTNEIALAKQVNEKLISAYKRKLNQYAEALSSDDELVNIHTRLQQTMLSALGQCFDYGGRLNNVQTVASKNMLSDINKIFSNILAPTEISIFDAVSLHEKSMSKVFKEPLESGQDSIIKLHKESLKNAIYKLNENEKTDAKHILSFHLAHILSKRNEKEQLLNLKLPQDCNPSPVLCLFITQSWLRIYVKTNDFTFITHGKNQDMRCPALVALNSETDLVFGYEAESKLKRSNTNAKYEGEICSYINSIKEKDEHTVITKLLTKIRYLANQVLAGSYSRLLLVVPSWCHVDHQRGLRMCAFQAGFLETYLVKGSSVAAYQILFSNMQQNLSGLNDIVIAVDITSNSLQVSIFGSQNDGGFKTVLLGLSKIVWDSDQSKNQDSSFFDKVKKKFSSSKSVKADTIPENAELYLNEAYNKALSQISAARKNATKYCILMTENLQWEKICNKYFSGQDITVLGEPSDCVVEGSATLSVDPRQIINKILNYVHINDGLKNISDSATPTSPPLDTNIDDYSSNVPTKKEESKEANLNKRKIELLQSCKRIKTQIENKEVKISRLFLKSVNETLERVIAIASHPDAGVDEISYEENEVNELITEHNFK